MLFRFFVNNPIQKSFGDSQRRSSLVFEARSRDARAWATQWRSKRPVLGSSLGYTTLHCWLPLLPEYTNPTVDLTDTNLPVINFHL